MQSSSRRDALTLTAATVAVGGIGIATWPLLAQMNPDASQEKPFTFDISGLVEGEAKFFVVDSKPIVVRIVRPAEWTVALNAADFPDKLARNANLPEAAASLADSRVVSPALRLLVMLAQCTKEGCVILASQLGPRYWQCPCCGSGYDVLGRVLSGPSKVNMAIPKCGIVDDRILKFVGEKS